MVVTFVEHDIDWNDVKAARLWDYYSQHSPYKDVYFSKVCGENILSLLPSTKAKARVLDFGCGPGFMIDHIKRRHLPWRYYGVEFSSSAAAAALERARTSAFVEEIKRIDKLPLDYEESFFDLIMLIEIVEHLEEGRLFATLNELCRLLRPGGRLCVSTPCEEDLDQSRILCPECGAKYHLFQHLRSWSEASLNDCMSRFSFRLVKTVKANFCRNKLKLWSTMLSGKVLGSRQPHMLCIYERGR